MTVSKSFKNHIYYFDNIVIGGNLRSLIFAIENKYPLVYLEDGLPLEWEYFDPSLKFDFYGFTNKTAEKKSIDEKVELVGSSKREMYANLVYMHNNLNCQAAFPVELNSIRVNQQRKSLKVHSTSGRLYKAFYENLHIFTHEKMAGLDSLEIPPITHWESFNFYQMKRFKGNYGIEFVRFEKDMPADWAKLHLERSDDIVVHGIVKAKDQAEFNSSIFMQRKFIESRLLPHMKYEPLTYVDKHVFELKFKHSIKRPKLKSFEKFYEDKGIHLNFETPEEVICTL